MLKDFVFAELWTDRTEWASENSRLLKQKFRSAALPLYATLSADGVERSRLLGVATADQFIAFLKKGLNETSSVDDALQESKRTGKPVFLAFMDVTGLNSLHAKVNVLEKPGVRSMVDRFVYHEAWIDRGVHAEANRRLLRERFKIAATPFYVTLGPDGEERSRLFGKVGEPEVLSFLDQGRSAAAK
ncbi:MAG TPA: hypothetical protein VJU16_07155 [Planctomycetota bacterium]|nr:hypothetical protein [Planctomycetota bacterium]